MYHDCFLIFRWGLSRTHVKIPLFPATSHPPPFRLPKPHNHTSHDYRQPHLPQRRPRFKSHPRQPTRAVLRVPAHSQRATLCGLRYFYCDDGDSHPAAVFWRAQNGNVAACVDACAGGCPSDAASGLVCGAARRHGVAAVAGRAQILRRAHPPRLASFRAGANFPAHRRGAV